MSHRPDHLNQRLKVNAHEWQHAVLYMDLQSTEGQTETTRKTHTQSMIRHIILLITAIFLFGLSSMISSDYGENLPLVLLAMMMVVTTGVLLFSIWRMRRAIQRFKKINAYDARYPSKYENIQLYEVSTEGISINYYNQEQRKSYLKWEDIMYASVNPTHYPVIQKTRQNRTYVDWEATEIELDNKVNEIIERYPDYPYQESVKPMDDWSLALVREGLFGVLGTDNILPIPNRWREDGTYDEFIAYIDQQLQEKRQISVEVLDFSTENVDLLQKLFPNLYDEFVERGYIDDNSQYPPTIYHDQSTHHKKE